MDQLYLDGVRKHLTSLYNKGFSFGAENNNDIIGPYFLKELKVQGRLDEIVLSQKSQLLACERIETTHDLIVLGKDDYYIFSVDNPNRLKIGKTYDFKGVKLMQIFPMIDIFYIEDGKILQDFFMNSLKSLDSETYGYISTSIREDKKMIYGHKRMHEFVNYVNRTLWNMDSAFTYDSLASNFNLNLK